MSHLFVFIIISLVAFVLVELSAQEDLANDDKSRSVVDEVISAVPKKANISVKIDEYGIDFIMPNWDYKAKEAEKWSIVKPYIAPKIIKVTKIIESSRNPESFSHLKEIILITGIAVFTVLYCCICFLLNCCCSQCCNTVKFEEYTSEELVKRNRDEVGKLKFRSVASSSSSSKSSSKGSKLKPKKA